MSRRFAAACLLVALVASPRFGAAQPDAERAVALGHEGIELFQKGRWQEARERFEAAEKIAHSPVLLVYMARARKNLGDLIGARDLYARVAGETIPADSPAPWQQAKTDAARELEEVTLRIPAVIISLRGRTEGATVTVDGAAVPGGALDRPLLLNPGRHALRAERRGSPALEKSVVLVEREPPQTIELSFDGPTTGSTSVPPTPPAGGDRGTRGSVVPGAILLSLGAAALGTGIVTGLISQSKADAVLGRCQSGHCLASDEDEGNAADALATVSTISFVAAAIAVPAGVALVIWRPFGGGGGAVALGAGPGAVTLRGAF